MNTADICKIIKEDIPETRNSPQLMNSLFILLTEVEKVVLRINELKSENKLVIDITIEKKL